MRQGGEDLFVEEWSDFNGSIQEARLLQRKQSKVSPPTASFLVRSLPGTRCGVVATCEGG